MKRVIAWLSVCLMLVTMMPVVSADNPYNDDNLDWGEHTEHVYAGCDDVSCDVCGAVREAGEHTYNAVVTAPDCINGGYTTYTCAVCGDSYVADQTAALGHVYDDEYDTTCNLCGEEREVEEPECSHEYTFPCSKFCALCGEMTRPDAACVEREEVKAMGDGNHVLNYYCVYCNEGLRGYPEECYGGEATCDKLAVCDVCNQEYGEYVDHTWTAATCTDPKTCSICGAIDGEALGHDMHSDVTIPATCEETGILTYWCPNCDYQRSELIPKMAHQYDDGKVIKKATCKSMGLKSYTCTVCGDVKTEIIPLSDTHTYVAATCTKAKTCKVCGVTSGKALGHDYEKKITKATLTKDGVIKNVCERCDYVASKTTTIYKASKISLSKTSYTYNGKVQKPSVIVKDSKGNTISSSNYTVTYASGLKNAGTYKVTVKMKGNYSDTKTLSYTIKGIDVSKCKITLSTISYTYNGSVKKPSVTVKNASGTKLTTSSYTVTYASGRKNVGTYKVTIKMKGNYTGTKTLTFKINPVKTSISKLTAGTKKLTVKWAKKSTQVTGYEIQYSTSKSFKSYKTKTVSSYKTTSATLSSLKAKTTYYVRVRTYKTVNGVKYYSGWTTVKYLKTK